jgi:hypothetical protein
VTFQRSDALEPVGAATGVTDHELPSQWLMSMLGWPLLRLGNVPPTAQQLQALGQVVPSSRSLFPPPVLALVTMFQPDGAAGAVGTASTPTTRARAATAARI